VLETLTAKGWVDDRRSAESFAASRKAMGWGPSKIRSAFFKRGIPGLLADQALFAEFGGEAEAESALKLLQAHSRRFLGSNQVSKPKGPEKALSFLLRRGFSYPSSRLAVQKVFSYNPELPEEDEN
jgi:SOS response regulatory protein OraA/RecX